MKHINYINIAVSISSFIYFCISLFSSLVVGLILYNYLIMSSSNLKEGFDPNELLTYDTNSPKLSHSVDVVNERYSCSNFCGPKAQCALTREQCSSDIDCKGCQPIISEPPKYLTTTEVKPLDDAGNLTFSQTPQYSSLTTDIGTFASYVKTGSLDNEVPTPYQGVDTWTKSFNYGLKLADDKLTYDYSPAQEEYRILPTYPITKTATGLFYDTGPTASNARL
jgi:hypothetical protein